MNGLNLLVAEDNDINWNIVQHMLEFCEIASVRAENGKICVDKINEAPNGTFDAILMDIHMPIMNGIEAVKTIRKSGREYVRRVPVIAMTADTLDEDIAACREAGMNGYVSKPLDIQKLVAELRKALNRNVGSGED